MSIPAEKHVTLTATRKRSMSVSLSWLRDYGIVVAFILLCAMLSIGSSAFLTTANLLNVLYQASPIGIIACGGTLVFIAGGFDLSAGAIATFAGIISAKIAANTGAGVPVALVAGALTGLGFGIANGLLVTVGKINAFITTFATSIMIGGLSLAVTSGFLITVTDPSFASIGTGGIGGLRYPVVVWIVFALLCGTLLWRTTLGRYMYAVGGNSEAARLSGVRIYVVRTAAFAASGLSGGIAGVLLASEVSTGQPDANQGLVFNAIAAIVLGGTSILGGEGAIWRTVLGSLLFQLIGNGFNLMNMQPVYQQVILGAVLLAAVGLDAWTRRTRT